MTVSGADHIWQGIPDEQVEEIFLHAVEWAGRAVNSQASSDGRGAPQRLGTPLADGQGSA